MQEVKTEVPGEKPVEACLDWKPNDIQRQGRESNLGSVVHSAGEVPHVSLFLQKYQAGPLSTILSY